MPEKMLPVAVRAGRKDPLNPASRGAEAIPAQRERRSRRAYRPCAAREDARRRPPAASGEQGTRHTAETASTTRTREYGGRRGCRGACPSHPLPPAAQATTPGCRAAAASQRRREERKKRNAPGDHAGCRAAAAIRRRKKKPLPATGQEPCPLRQRMTARGAKPLRAQAPAGRNSSSPARSSSARRTSSATRARWPRRAWRCAMRSHGCQSSPSCCAASR